MEFLDHDDEEAHDVEVVEDDEGMHYVVDDEEVLYVVVVPYEGEQYVEERHVVAQHEGV